jgi:translation initiation factor IF-2
MEQRPLRLGDIVDDYCPRERRITNHAIVAIVEDSIRQTRCTTCDTEHAYKGAREPKRRRGTPEPALAPPADLAARPGPPRAAAPEAGAADAPEAAAGAPSDPPVSAPADPAPAEDTRPAAEDAWPAHRQLIRATLPRTDGEPPAPRPIPEFTMHQRQGRGGFRYGASWNGNGPDRGNSVRQGRPAFGNGRGPNPQGSGQGHGTGQGSGRRRRRRHKPPR